MHSRHPGPPSGSSILQGSFLSLLKIPKSMPRPQADPLCFSCYPSLPLTTASAREPSLNKMKVELCRPILRKAWGDGS